MTNSIERYLVDERMSKAVIFGNIAYLSGQVADPNSVGIVDQTISVLNKIDHILAGIGSDKAKLLCATLYIKDMVDFASMNTIWDGWIPPGIAPARTCVQAHLAREELLVEISIIAAI